MESQISHARFQTTRWSVVLRTRRTDQQAHRALDEICRTYWLPLYAFARRWGKDRPDAEDAVQSFFLTAVERQLFANADPREGRLRNLLLTAFKHHLLDSLSYASAARRKPTSPEVQIDFEATERRIQQSSQQASQAETLFDQEWAHSVLQLALERLKNRYRLENKEALFEALRPRLIEDSSVGMSSLADSLGMTSSALGVALHRLRKRYREALREAIAETVETEAELEAEFRDLARVLLRPNE